MVGQFFYPNIYQIFALFSRSKSHVLAAESAFYQWWCELNFSFQMDLKVHSKYLFKSVLNKLLETFISNPEGI